MPNIRKYWSVVAVVLIVALGMVIFQPAANPVQASGSAPVIVTNTPLPVQGTVGVSNFPTALAVSGSVGVNNFPATQTVNGTVGISGTPTVQVANTTPLPVTAADNPAIQPVQNALEATVDSGGNCAVTFPGPGSGQRLVIEYVSAVISSQTTGSKTVDMIIVTKVNGISISHFAAPSYVVDSGTSQRWEASQPTHLYADPDTNVTILGRGPLSLAGADCYFAYSGYLVNLP